jgi:hypothetical protein
MQGRTPKLALWVSVNHLHGIMALNELDPALYQKLANP